MERTLICLLIASALTGCPAQAPVTSVDGLAGGALTTAVSAPALSAPSVSFEIADGKSLTLDQMSTNELDVGRVIVSGGIARIGETTLNVLGFPVGAVPFASSIPVGYVRANAKCDAAFPAAEGELAAHVCSQQEVFIAVQTNASQIPDDVLGAGYNTFAFGAPIDLGDPNGLIAINDCLAWGSMPAAFANAPQNVRDMAAALEKNDEGYFPSFVQCGESLRLSCCR